MRRCIVDSCTNTDQIIRCHRFPKNRTQALNWQTSLNLNNYPLDTLITKCAVCCMHFDRSDYRNPASNSLNFTALPKLRDINPRQYAITQTNNSSQASESQPPSQVHIPNVKLSDSPTNESDSIELLHHDDDAVTEIDESFTSSNLGIFIDRDDTNATDALIQSIEGADFTMLDAGGCTMCMPYVDDTKTLDNTDESSALILDSKYSSGQPLNDFRPSSTDSDVEVLVTETMFESQWSETDRCPISLNVDQTNTSDGAVSPCLSYRSDLSTKTNALELFESEFDNLNRYQLIELIKGQTTRIQELETKLSTFKLAQEQLVMHFDTFRNTVCGVHL